MTRGVLAVIFGILGFASLLPIGTMRTFAMLVGIFAILDGVANGIEAARRQGTPLVLRGAAGLVGVVFGILAMVMTGLSMTGLIWMTGIWAFVIGGLDVVSNLIERDSAHRDWLFGLIMGAIAVIFAILAVITMPALTAMVWLIAVATVLWGVAGLIMGGNERGASRR
jgi:uncharacterized membrane protein HdeD (DUF308 family)